MSDEDELTVLDEIFGDSSFEVTSGPDPYVTYRFGTSTKRNITIHSFILKCYADGRWVSTVDIENVSRHSNWDVWINVAWVYTTGHPVTGAGFEAFHTAINHQKRRTEQKLGTSAWLGQNYDFIQRADVRLNSGWRMQRNN